MTATVDNKTPRLDMPLPDAQNFLQDDVGRLIETINDLDKVVALVGDDGKLKPEQLPDNAAQWDANKKIDDAVLSDKVVLLDDTGKIPVGKIPAAAMPSYRDVSNEIAMTQLVALPGDFCHRLDNDKYYVLVKSPATVTANWRELPPSAVYSVNGQSGDITGIAKSGVNSDITRLTGLQGPVALPADGVSPYDAVTLRQLSQVTAGQGATMNGVMNNFIGAVEWFNGTRAMLPAGYIAADGQTLTRTNAATIDLWAAVNAGMFISCSEKDWLTGSPSAPTWNRASYSLGDGATTFRVPDLNGGFTAQTINGTAYSGSLGAIHLVGQGADNPPNWPGRSSGHMYPQAVPNITGNPNSTALTYASNVGNDVGAGAFKNTDVQAMGGTGTGGTVARYNYYNFTFDASKSDSSYGRNGLYNNPNDAAGIWIIRASGAFQAANTTFDCINSDATLPPVGTSVTSGQINVRYLNAGKTLCAAGFNSSMPIGGSPSGVWGVAKWSDTTNALSWRHMDFDWETQSLKLTGRFQGGGALLYSFRSMAVQMVTDSTTMKFVQADVTNANMAYKQISQIFSSNRAGQIWTVEGWSGAISDSTSDVSRMSWACGFCDGGGYSRAWMLRNDAMIVSPNGRGLMLDGAGEIKLSTIIDATKPTSDITLKDNITAFDIGISLLKVNALEIKSFMMKDDATKTVRRGVIAQQARNVDKAYVDGSIDHLRMEPYPLLIDALASIQVLTQRNDALEKRLAALEAS
jgi:hypothetical protein